VHMDVFARSKERPSLGRLKLTAQVGYGVAMATGVEAPVIVVAKAGEEWVALLSDAKRLYWTLVSLASRHPDASKEAFFLFPISEEEEPVIVRVAEEEGGMRGEVLSGDKSLVPLSVKRALGVGIEA